MKINHRNLTIAKYAGREDMKNGTVLRALRVAPEGTFATDGYIAINVSALESSEFDPLLLDAATVKATAAIMGNEPFDHVAIPAPVISSVVKHGSPTSLENDEEPKAITSIRASFLLRIALAALEFGDGKDVAVAIEIPHEPKMPIVFRAEDSQKWTGFAMPATDGTIGDSLNLNGATSAEEILADANKVAER